MNARASDEVTGVWDWIDIYGFNPSLVFELKVTLLDITGGTMSNAERQKRYRERNATVTNEAPTVTESPESVTPVRINPRNGQPYGPGMLEQGERVLASYESHYGQVEPIWR